MKSAAYYPYTAAREAMMERFFGGSPLAVIFQLAIASIMIGVLLSVLGYDPRDIYGALRSLTRWISEMGFDSARIVFQYLALGAIIVVPIWLLTRVFGLLGSSRNKR